MFSTVTFESRDVAPGMPFRPLFISCGVVSEELLSQHRLLSRAPLGELSLSLLVPEQSLPAEGRPEGFLCRHGHRPAEWCLLLLVNGYGSVRMLPEEPNASLPFALKAAVEAVTAAPTDAAASPRLGRCAGNSPSVSSCLLLPPLAL